MKLGIVGAGVIVHTLLEFVHELSEIELVAICTTAKSLEKLNTLKAEHGFRYVYTDYEQMLKNDEIDTVYLGVNNQFHYRYGKRALESGFNLIMEKPSHPIMNRPACSRKLPMRNI